MISSTIWPLIPAASSVGGSSGIIGSLWLCVTFKKGFELLSSFAVVVLEVAAGALEREVLPDEAGPWFASRLILSSASSNPFEAAFAGENGVTG